MIWYSVAVIICNIVIRFVYNQISIIPINFMIISITPLNFKLMFNFVPSFKKLSSKQPFHYSVVVHTGKFHIFIPLFVS